jgi:hypothetical protein
MVEEPIVVLRNSDTAVQFVISGVDLTGTTVEFWRKPLAEDPDPSSPLYSTATGSAALIFPSIGQCVVQIAAADVGVAGGSHYHLDGVKNGRRQVLAYGPMFVRNR